MVIFMKQRMRCKLQLKIPWILDDFWVCSHGSDNNYFSFFLFHGNFLWITLGFDVPNLVPWNRVPLRLLVVKSTTQKSLNRRQSTKKWTIFPVYVSINNGWIIHLHPVMRFNQFLRGSSTLKSDLSDTSSSSKIRNQKRSFFSKMSIFLDSDQFRTT